MRRKGLLDRLHLRHHGPSASSSAVQLNNPTSLSVPTSDNSPHIPSTVEPWKLVALPRQRAYPHHAVGIDDQVNSVIKLLQWENETNAAVAVILHGFGGTGKTTVAEAVVATLDIQGWDFSTVVPVQAEAFGEGETHKDVQFEKEQAFIYMDNFMVPGEHLQKLLVLPKINCKKLRLLLTARDEMVADVIKGCGIPTHVYPVGSLLSQDACMELLCNKMGVAGTILQIPQVNDILRICDGVPLVVERVGAYICQSLDKDEAYRRVIEWSEGGEPFSSAQEHSIEENGLVFDLDELPASAKEPFLDICSFFNGWDWDKVSCILGEDVLNALQKRALLLKKEDCTENKVTVRPIILTIARIMTKGKRFTSVHDLNKVLQGSELDDIRGIKGIWLEDNISQPFLISAKMLDLMHASLRVVALGDMVIVVDGRCTHKFKQVIYFQAGLIPYIPFHPATSQELRFLDWLPHKDDDLQLSKMSSKLKLLILNGGRYDRRFDTASAFGRLRGLKTLKMTGFKTLKNLPDEISFLTQLEELDLSGCIKLVQLPQRLGSLRALAKLNLQSCGSLQELPDSFGKLRSLKHLDLRYCQTLKHLPQDFGSLRALQELDLGELGSLEGLPSSFEKLSSLKVLNMRGCRSDLNHLPDNIRNLSVFVQIQVVGSRLASIPPSFQLAAKYSFPVSVSMADCSLLPRELCTYLKLVKDLSFRYCELLTNLPNQLTELDSLTRLDLGYCQNLERLPEGFGQLKSLAELNLEGCYSLQQLSTDFHSLASLQSLSMQRCENLEGKWMDSVVKIKTLDLINIEESQMLLMRWAEMELEKEQGQQSWRFILRTGHKKWKNVDNLYSKLLSEEYLFTDIRGEPFSLSTVEPNTLLLVMYDEQDKDSSAGSWTLLEEVVKQEHSLTPFKMIYVGKYFRQLSKGFTDRIMACASLQSDASSLLFKVLQVTTATYDYLPKFLVTEVLLDEEGRKCFSKWKNIRDSDEFLLSNSKLYSDLKKLTQPAVQKSNVKLLKALFADVAESTASSIFFRNYTESTGIDQLHGKTVLLLISVMDEHPFECLKEIYSKVISSDNLEILSIPIPVDVRGQPYCRSRLHQLELPDSDLAGFENILRNVPWPVLRNPWLLKLTVYYFIEREWGRLNPGILVVVDPNGRICHKNALPLLETWGSQVLPFSEEKMKQLEQRKQVEQESLEEHLSEYILNGLFQKWS
ncbi:hypothetical protein KI387_035321 [Taxus chinensis]|uniref:NB-ARC domain-containing protein n=1 Tax=Taxus chinensis TaxID=29808 RepID=A0AA38FP66_TAXCH|nr:hypothetical protein KI387_035321 [Taxus chinensis]